MRSEELNSELAGILTRMRSRILADPALAKALALDNQDHSKQVILEGIEQAILGLVMLHMQVRRDQR